MALSTVRKVRAFELLLTTLNLGLTIAAYILISTFLSRSPSSRTGLFPLDPIQYLDIATASFLFFGYLYSLFCSLYKLNRIIRAILMSVLAITLIVVQVIFMVDQIKENNTPDENGYVSPLGPFSCEVRWKTCNVANAKLFVAIIVGLFALVEVVVTLVVKEEKKEKYVYEDRDDDDDSDGGSVIIF
ncbi:MAG: hypothetical protein JOS17DRAFT_770586 [Linnemannia elongata]|nr:MAG: hypothetical protein JOS17DRAFT_770586 [Linnemannia elongata]